MKPSDVIVSQYLASLEMLKQAVTGCPDEMWNNPADSNKFWHIAYHALFYTHFYLQDSAETFTAWERHIEGYHDLSELPEAGLVKPYEKDAVLEYLSFCQGQVAERVPSLDLEAPSGFYWLPLNKLELQIYSIRHIQQHTGELMDRLSRQAGVELHWVGKVHPVP